MSVTTEPWLPGTRVTRADRWSPAPGEPDVVPVPTAHLELLEHDERRYRGGGDLPGDRGPLHLVCEDVARAEGEGFADAADWLLQLVAFRTEVAERVSADAGDRRGVLRDTEPVLVHGLPQPILQRLSAER